MLTNKSEGADKIKKYLLKKGISFVTEERWLKDDGESYVKFDFTIRPIRDAEKNNSGVYAGSADFVGFIEFDGKQHFEENKMCGGKFGLLKIHENDIWKNSFCQNRLPLLRIKYNQVDDIEMILDDFLLHSEKYMNHEKAEWDAYYDYDAFR